MPLRLWLSAWPHVAVVANVDVGSQLIAGFWAGCPPTSALDRTCRYLGSWQDLSEVVNISLV